MTALPPALDRFGAELELAVQRDLGARRRRRRLLGAATLPAAVAAVVLGILAVLPGGGPSVVGRAAAALQGSDESILHVQMRGEQRNPDGSVVTWQDESWQLGIAPYTYRQVEVGSDGVRAESLVRGNTNELYDAVRDTIYVTKQQQLAAANRPKIKVVSAARLRELTHGSGGGVALKVAEKGGYSVVATKEGAKRFRAQIAADEQGSAGAAEDPFRAEILALLRSGHAHETGHVEIGGRDAIGIESSDGKKVYLVDPVTYAPIEWVSTGNGGSVTLTFPVYEELAVDADSMKVFDLLAQHPGARVVRDVDAYQAAEARLYPHG
jgi:hypothetical protein